MFEVSWDDAEIRRALRKLQGVGVGLSGPLQVVGLKLVESTKQRFAAGVGPDGAPWQANTAATLARKSGSKPLVNHGDLERQISYAVSGDVLEVFSTQAQAAMMQFGGTKAEFPHLWGDIPARPFLGVSAADEVMILAIVERYLKNAL